MGIAKEVKMEQTAMVGLARGWSGRVRLFDAGTMSKSSRMKVKRQHSLC